MLGLLLLRWGRTQRTRGEHPKNSREHRAAQKDSIKRAPCFVHAHRGFLFCFVLFALQLSMCLWWHDYRRDDFPTLKFGVVMADLLDRHSSREEPFALAECRPHHMGR